MLSAAGTAARCRISAWRRPGRELMVMRGAIAEGTPGTAPKDSLPPHPNPPPQAVEGILVVSSVAHQVPEQRGWTFSKRVEHSNAMPGEAVLEVLAQQKTAAVFRGYGQDQGVPDLQTVIGGNIQRAQRRTMWNLRSRRCPPSSAAPCGRDPRRTRPSPSAPDTARRAFAPAARSAPAASGLPASAPGRNGVGPRHLLRRPGHWCPVPPA